MPSTGAERRRSPRVEVALDLELSRGRGNPVAARTIDLCDHGMRIMSSRPLRVDEVLRFELTLPWTDGHLDGEARVVREHPRNVYALRVETLDERHAAQLWRFVAEAA